MELSFYAPFKPVDHPHPSGDQMIAKSLVRFLEQQGHTIEIHSRLRTRWIYFKPWLWLWLVKDFLKIIWQFRKKRPDIWLTYHTYYKAPDVLGPLVCRLLGIPYVVFQGIYATKYQRQLKTMAGFYLNRAALNQADHVFANKKSDFKNLKRLIPLDRLTYIKPGIRPEIFVQDSEKRNELRKQWLKKECPVILTAAMFRDDVKTQSLSWLIDCCSVLIEQNIEFYLVIAGSGVMEEKLQTQAEQMLPGHHLFVGKIQSSQMNGFYSAGDIFAFPGINESLGMVFLEAQSCSLPVVAFDNAGVPEAVKDKISGFLTPLYDCKAFTDKLEIFLTDEKFCKKIGSQAALYVREEHNIEENYKQFEQILFQLLG